ncbi:Pellicle/biofilm biosynthesis protein PelA, glycosyl hydrolase/deacetylase [hydrothermal vent metagenome]|uniref:Pellicle/biofilm biosynthesis protein PelA, glycosyl hydrolase/deacetylase n=1 Tax=hydrothermal vent metagenome TaxID=652676 RepID=A0A3B1BL96_9ZZZZ
MVFNFLDMRICSTIFLLFGITLSSLSAAGEHSQASASAPDIAFFYGQSLPLQALQNFDQLVVQPDHVTPLERRQLQHAGVKMLAYVSIGEIAKSDKQYDKLNSDWISGNNPNWASRILDVRNSAVASFLWQHYIKPAKNSDYQGVFLDTLDSYQLVAKTDAQRESYKQGLARIIKDIKNRWPDAIIIINRGFGIIPRIASQINGVVAESLFSAFGGDKEGYTQVSATDRQWLINSLNQIKKNYQLPITVVDYLPDDRWQEAAGLARKIDALGFTPWISDGHLNNVGRGRLQPQPRKILALYDNNKDDIYESNTHRRLAEPLEYMGYQLDYLNINRQALPPMNLRGRYAGIVSWFSGKPLKLSKKHLCQWLKRQRQNGLYISIFGELPAAVRCAKLFNIKSVNNLSGKTFSLSQRQESVGQFEAKLRVRHIQIPDIASTRTNAKRWLQLEASTKIKSTIKIDPIVIDDWGGYALSPYVTVDGADGTSKWLFNPFKFLRKSLRLNTIPAVDISTESGRRILTIHIDGDGFVSHAELPGTPYAGAVIFNRIIKHYRLPTTVSIIEAEIGAKGLYSKQTPALEKIARSIFRLPYVEVATHTFSHPFFWQVFDGDYDVGKAVYGLNLPVPGYSLNLKREIIGSTNYINTHLAPKNKQVKMILWSGNTRPGASAVKMATDDGLLNVNGGDTWPLPYHSSISMIWPVGRPTGGGLQVYAPVLNEDVYTNDWQGPYYGYRDAIWSFKFLETPRRLKPIGIYYHFYSGTKLASINALKQVYDWALKQQPIPLYLSQYAQRANAFYRASLAQKLDGSWSINTATYIHTLRLPKNMGWPDLTRSTGIAGYRQGKDGVYVSLSSNRPRLYLQSKPDPRLHLVNTNGVVKYWRRNKKNIQLSLSANVAISLTVAPASSCELKTSRHRYHSQTQGMQQIFSLPVKMLKNAKLICR